VTGVRRNVWETTLEEIRALEAGRWFAPEFDGEPIPTLTECIELSRGRIKLLIELKYNGHDVALADRVLDIVEAEDVADECLFMSLEMRGLEEVKTRRPDIPCGLTVGSSIGNIAGLDVDFVAIGQRQLNRLTYDALLNADVQIWVWTVNERAGMVRFLARDIEGLITDDPAAAFAIRNELDELETPERLILAFRYRLPF
jgi:glycerophosphoryl diester phosphodiesterase